MEESINEDFLHEQINRDFAEEYFIKLIDGLVGETLNLIEQEEKEGVQEIYIREYTLFKNKIQEYILENQLIKYFSLKSNEKINYDYFDEWIEHVENILELASEYLNSFKYDIYQKERDYYESEIIERDTFIEDQQNLILQKDKLLSKKEEENAKKEKKIIESVKLIEKLREELIILKDYNGTLLNENKLIVEKNEEITKVNLKLSLDNDGLRKNQGKLDIELNSLIKQNTDLRNKVEILENTNKILESNKEEVIKLNREKNQREKAITILENQNAKFSGEIIEKTKKNDNLENKVAELKGVIEDLRSEKSRVTSENMIVNKAEIKGMELEINRLKHQLHEKDNEIQKHTTKLKTLKNELNNYKSKEDETKSVLNINNYFKELNELITNIENALNEVKGFNNAVLNIFNIEPFSKQFILMKLGLARVIDLNVQSISESVKEEIDKSLTHIKSVFLYSVIIDKEIVKLKDKLVGYEMINSLINAILRGIAEFMNKYKLEVVINDSAQQQIIYAKSGGIKAKVKDMADISVISAEQVFY